MTEMTEADQVLAAIEDAERMWPHNDHLINDPKIQEGVLAAIRRQAPTPGEVDASFSSRWDGGQSQDQPLLRRVPTAAKHSFSATPLIQAVVDRIGTLQWPCDLCLRSVTPARHLWVPAGRSVVQFDVCSRCVERLDEQYAPVVWS